LMGRTVGAHGVRCFHVLVLLLFLFPLHDAGAFEVKIMPAEIRPGDAFLVVVESKDGHVPVGRAGRELLSFHMTGPGRFIALASVGLEENISSLRVSVKQGESVREMELAVMPRKTGRVSLTLPDDRVVLSPQDEKRADMEARTLRHLWSKRNGRYWNGPFVPPLDTEVSTGFGIVRIINGHKRSVHRGVDFRGRRGMPVRAINDGVISLTAEHFFGGRTVMVDHGEGLFSLYMHLDRILVKEGDRVSRAEPVGLVGSTGRATGPHLHLSVKKDGYTIDPLSLFSLPIEEMER